MHSQVGPEFYPLVRATFAALYLLWALLWIMVAFYYGRAAYASWLSAGGLWRRAAQDVFRPFVWAVKSQLCKWGLLKGDHCDIPSVPSPYDPGTMLRFAIFLGTITPINFGLQFFSFDRSDWSWFRTLTTLASTTISCLGAGSHLFLAYRNYPETWRRFVLLLMFWMGVGPALFYLIYYVI